MAFTEGHKARFIDKDLIVHTSRTVRHRNIWMVAFITAIFPTQKIWLQDVTNAYIQVHDLQGDVQVRPAK